MAKLGVQIQFPESPASMVGRALNCIEDIYRDVMESGIGSVESDIDSFGTGEFIVRAESRRHYGNVLEVVKAQLRRHNLAEITGISRCSY